MALPLPEIDPEKYPSLVSLFEDVAMHIRKGEAVAQRLEELVAGINAVTERHRAILYAGFVCGCFPYYCHICGYEHNCIHRPVHQIVFMLHTMYQETE